jgi:nucleoside-diphosphate-sugar epimerase
MRALVTGGTGFIGSHVVDLLVENGHDVRVVSRRRDLPDRWKGRPVSLVTGDLGEPRAFFEALRGCDVLFHSGEIKTVNRPAARRNVQLMKQVLEQLTLADVRRMVFVSSISVAGVPAEVPATEDTPPATVLNDHYTWYKRECEKLIRASAGVEHVIIRPAVVYGPRSRSLRAMAKVIAATGAIGLPFTGKGTNLMPLVHVGDLARAIYHAGVVPDAARQTFNITDGTPHRWKEFFEAIAAAAGKTMHLLPVPPILVRVPALFGDLFTGLFGISADLPSYIQFLSRDVHFSMAKAERILGWRAVHTDVRAGVREMMERDAST